MKLRPVRIDENPRMNAPSRIGTTAVIVVVGLDHALDWGLFDPARKGDPVLFQHLFWF